MNNDNKRTGTIWVSGLTIGEGKPKICIPLTARHADELMEEVLTVLPKKPDMFEWRADHFIPLWKELEETRGAAIDAEDQTMAYGYKKVIKDVIENIFNVCAPKVPVIFTVRTDMEGGELYIDEEAYKDALMHAINVLSQYGSTKLIDVEMKRNFAPAIINKAHQKGMFVISSFHDFDKTPPTAEIAGILKNGEKLGGDISKIAVMPREQSDVSKLLNGAKRAHEDMNIPFIAISMGELGKLTRISGHLFGSCITFAKGMNTSAPGQIDAAMLRRIIG